MLVLLTLHAKLPHNTWCLCRKPRSICVSRHHRIDLLLSSSHRCLPPFSCAPTMHPPPCPRFAPRVTSAPPHRVRGPKANTGSRNRGVKRKSERQRERQRRWGGAALQADTHTRARQRGARPRRWSFLSVHTAEQALRSRKGQKKEEARRNTTARRRKATWAKMNNQHEERRTRPTVREWQFC